MELRNEDLKPVFQCTNNLTKSSQSSRKGVANIETTIQQLSTLLCLDISKESNIENNSKLKKEVQEREDEFNEDTTDELSADALAAENKQLLMDIQRIEAVTLKSKELLDEKQRIFTSLVELVTVNYSKENKSVEGFKSKTEDYLELLQKSKENVWIDTHEADVSIKRLSKIIQGLQEVINE